MFISEKKIDEIKEVMIKLSGWILTIILMMILMDYFSR